MRSFISIIYIELRPAAIGEILYSDVKIVLNCQYLGKYAFNQNLVLMKKCLKSDFIYWVTISERFCEYLTFF